jgi:hypothetical protein
MNNTGGKGSMRRPNQTAAEQFSNAWDTIFGKKKDTQCVGECNICIKNPDVNQVLQITEPIKNDMVQ